MADRDCKLEFRYFGTSQFSRSKNSDYIIPESGLPVCTLSYQASFKNQTSASKHQEISTDTKANVSKPERYKKTYASKRTARKQIQSDLNELKQLREDGLISEETWVEKQKEILKDY